VQPDPPAALTLGSGGPKDSGLSKRLEQLIDQAPSVGVLRAHRLHLAAARIWRSRGVEVPEELIDSEHLAEVMAIAAPLLLARACAAYDGRLLLMKGAEVAAWYQCPSDRAFRDLDLLADDAPAAQRALIDAGFIEIDDPNWYGDKQHLCPLAWPGLPLVVEVHRHPNQPAWLPRAGVAEIIETATASATEVDGLLAPAPAVHALLLVAHSWISSPLRRLADLLDLSTILGPAGREDAYQVARRWGWDGMLGVSLAATDAVFGDVGRSVSVGVWARHLTGVRDQTVLEDHLARIAAPVSALPLRRLPNALARVLRDTAARREAESWADKRRRTRLAAAHAFTPQTSHVTKLTSRAGAPREVEPAADVRDLPSE
jgi:hypothetical protein